MSPIDPVKYPHIHPHPPGWRRPRGPVGCRTANLAMPHRHRPVAADIGGEHISGSAQLDLFGVPIAADPADFPA